MRWFAFYLHVESTAWPHYFSKSGGVGLEFIALYLDIFTSLMSSDLNIEQFQRTIFGNFVD